jgi:hypothetical protein
MAKWEPIETAPKDGTPILGYAYGKYAVVYWEDVLTVSGHKDGCWALFVPGTWVEDDWWIPTHWHSLPEAPTQAVTSDKRG